jgi:hypothetical protein
MVDDHATTRKGDVANYVRPGPDPAGRVAGPKRVDSTSSQPSLENGNRQRRAAVPGASEASGAALRLHRHVASPDTRSDASSRQRQAQGECASSIAVVSTIGRRHRFDRNDAAIVAHGRYFGGRVICDRGKGQQVRIAGADPLRA